MSDYQEEARRNDPMISGRRYFPCRCCGRHERAPFLDVCGLCLQHRDGFVHAWMKGATR